MDIGDILMYILFGCAITILISFIISVNITLFVTPLVDEYNGSHKRSGLFSNSLRMNTYLLAFFTPKFYRKTKIYREELVYLKAKPIHKLLIRINGTLMFVSCFCFLFITAIFEGWFNRWL